MRGSSGSSSGVWRSISRWGEHLWILRVRSMRSWLSLEQSSNHLRYSAWHRLKDRLNGSPNLNFQTHSTFLLLMKWMIIIGCRWRTLYLLHYPRLVRSIPRLRHYEGRRIRVRSSWSNLNKLSRIWRMSRGCWMSWKEGRVRILLSRWPIFVSFVISFQSFIRRERRRQTF